MSMRILIVDDETLIASSLKVFLEDEGFMVAAAGSGEAALELIKQDDGFDVCVMDMRLPGLDGNATIRQLHDLSPELRFIIHTGSIDYRVPADLQNLGIHTEHLFHKPLIDMRPIADAIRSIAPLKSSND
jgi:DNA-binding NtrC family response regulator